MLKSNHHRLILPSSQTNIASRPHKSPFHKNTIIIQFKEDRKTFGKAKVSKARQEQHFFRTFYNSKDTHYMHRYQRNRTKRVGRETAFTERDSVIGTPFSSLQAKDNQIPVPVFPSLDRQRYRYLLTAITGISKNKKLPEFKTPPNLKVLENFNSDSITPESSPFQCCEIGSPRIVNVSADFQPASRSGMKLELDNWHQKTTKNKRLLQKGRYNSFRQSQHRPVDAFLLGDEELKVQQLSIRYRKAIKKE